MNIYEKAWVARSGDWYWMDNAGQGVQMTRRDIERASKAKDEIEFQKILKSIYLKGVAK